MAGVQQDIVLKATVQGGKLRVSNIPIGPTALASIGTNTTDINGQWWITDIFVPISRRVTIVGFLQGGTATTDNIIVAIWDASGAVLANSALAGVILSGASTFQEQTLLTAVTLTGPGQYFVGVQGNGTAAGAIYTVPTTIYGDLCTTSQAGTFGTVPAITTPPTTMTTNVGPIVYLK